MYCETATSCWHKRNMICNSYDFNFSALTLLARFFFAKIRSKSLQACAVRRKDLNQHCAKQNVMPVGHEAWGIFFFFVWAVSHSSQWIILLLFADLFHDGHGGLQFGVGKKHVSYKKSQLISLVSHCTLNTPNKHWNIIPVFKSINLSLMSGCIMFPLPFVTCKNNSCALFYYLLNYVSTFYVWNVKDCRTSGNSVGSHLFQEIVLDMSFGSLQREVQLASLPLDCPAGGREFDLQVSIIKHYLLKSLSAGADKELPYGSC